MTQNQTLNQKQRESKQGDYNTFKDSYLAKSRKERDAVDGEFITYSVDEILSKEEFHKKAPEMQGALLLDWIEKYSMDDIAVGMGMSYLDLRNLKQHYGIKGIHGARKHIQMFGNVVLDDEFLNAVDANFKISYEEFKKLDKDSQLKLVVKLKAIHYTNKKLCENALGVKELKYTMNLLGKNQNKIKALGLDTPKTRTRKSKKAKEEATKTAKSKVKSDDNSSKMPINQTFHGNVSEQQSFQESLSQTIESLEKSLGNESVVVPLKNELIPVQEELVATQEESVATQEVAATTPDVNPSNNRFHLGYNGTYAKNQLKRKLSFILEEIEDSNSNEFELSLDISEKE